MQVIGYVRVSTEEQGRSGAGLQPNARPSRRSASAEVGCWSTIDRGSRLLGQGSARPGHPAGARELERGGPAPWSSPSSIAFSRSMLDFTALMAGPSAGLGFGGAGLRRRHDDSGRRGDGERACHLRAVRASPDRPADQGCLGREAPTGSPAGPSQDVAERGRRAHRAGAKRETHARCHRRRAEFRRSADRARWAEVVAGDRPERARADLAWAPTSSRAHALGESRCARQDVGGFGYRPAGGFGYRPPPGGEYQGGAQRRRRRSSTSRRTSRDAPPSLTAGCLGAKVLPLVIAITLSASICGSVAGADLQAARPGWPLLCSWRFARRFIVGVVGARLHRLLFGSGVRTQWGGIRAGEGEGLLVGPLQFATGMGVRDWVVGAARSDTAALFTSPSLRLRLQVVMSGRGLLAGS